VKCHRWVLANDLESSAFPHNLMVTYCQLGVSFHVIDGRPHSIDGQVAILPIAHVHNFILEGLSHSPTRRDMYLSDIQDIVDESSGTRASGPEGFVLEVERSRRFIRLARPFFRISVTLREVDNSAICCDCATPFTIVEDRYVCPRCCHTAIIRTTIRPMARIINVNTEMQVFMEAIDSLEGKTRFPASAMTITFEILDAYCVLNTVPTSAQASEMQLLPSGVKARTSIEHMLAALKIGKLSYEKHANFLAHIYWGWRQIDISDVREIVLQNYAKILSVIEPVLIKNGRQKNLPAWFHLFKSLTLAKFSDTHIEHFRTSKTNPVVEQHSLIWSEAIVAAGIL
jgi:hypothetical protein